MKKKIIGLIFLGIALLIARLAASAASEILPTPEPFPVYPCLQTNVDFWKKVYSEYTLEQGIIHDSWNLAIIYEVIDLEDSGRPGAFMINKRRIKRAEETYKKILSKLARGNPPSSPEEQRVVDLFGPTATRKDFEQARRNVRCQLGQMDRFQEGIIRSGAYLEQIKAVFASYGLPPDLAYLPHVESSFNHEARSKSRAAGIWQFTSPTGKRFLKIGQELDERRDPIFSSHAAARLLRENYQVLRDWPMAITAYNHGLGGMVKAKRTKKTYEAIFSEYKSRSFKFASRNFYAEFLAARDVAKSYRQYFGDIELKNPPSTHEVVVGNRVPVKDLARYFNVNVADIKNLNPSLKESVYRGQKSLPKGYTLRLPLATPAPTRETPPTESVTDLQESPREWSLMP
ncbi:MAG TPA: lytic transglycosylase domain-containing protein [Syntrophobacteria bacterium]|nr:lytic transglycosylase domain-containing protein [Syntrophobacteria bacterium]